MKYNLKKQKKYFIIMILYSINFLLVFVLINIFSHQKKFSNKRKNILIRAYFI